MNNFIFRLNLSIRISLMSAVMHALAIGAHQATFITMHNEHNYNVILLNWDFDFDHVVGWDSVPHLLAQSYIAVTRTAVEQKIVDLTARRILHN